MSNKNQRSLIGAITAEIVPAYGPLLQVMDEVCASVAEHELN